MGKRTCSLDSGRLMLQGLRKSTEAERAEANEVREGEGKGEMVGAVDEIASNDFGRAKSAPLSLNLDSQG